MYIVHFWSSVLFVGTLRVLESVALSKSGDSSRLNSARSLKSSERNNGPDGIHSARSPLGHSARFPLGGITSNNAGGNTTQSNFLIPFEEPPAWALTKHNVVATTTNSITTAITADQILSHSLDEEKTPIYHPNHHPVGGGGGGTHGRTGEQHHKNKKGGAAGYNEKVGLLHLLIVDDSTLSRKMLSKVFCASGHTCDMAENGEIAVEKMRVNMNDVSNGVVTNGIAIKLYDAVLTDFEMPVMNGPTSVREIRRIGFKNKIFGLTGNALTEQVLNNILYNIHT